ncbi:MATH and LRR domain-containing protein PFE0570w-like isoform X1 [Vespula maculifrons]|uniref:MATH and LRR domain-containing protein PFE0570w-like isoform X1 n=1 Tax=Vespula maculifrons TaxID=7453 RepID=A0ABD2AKW5_VESMC
MSEYCFLCLTDEGVFLDITPTNYKSLRGDVEKFLSLKVEKNINKTNRVCYKCAFELRQCNDFLKKYKEARKTIGSKIYERKCCTFCLETKKRGYLNHCLHPLNNFNEDLISKVQQLFQDDLVEYNKEIILMCLSCRYSLDILFDLKSLYLEFSKERDRFDKNKDYSTLPKVNTIVIKRKTTITASMKTRSYILSNPDSDSSVREENSEVTMNKNVGSPRLKSRFCDACKTSVKDGEDMYRFYKTRLTVCKTCWTSMDPSKCITRLKKPIRTDTKLCAVFLKDVLTDVTFKQHKTYKVEKDSYGNNLYIITDSESEVDVEDKMDTEPLQSRGKLSNGSDNKPKIGKKRSKVNTKSDSSDSETKSIKRIKHDKETKSKSKSKLQDAKPVKKKSTTRNHYSDTDISSNKTLRITRAKGLQKEDKKVYSLSDVDTDNSQRKKQDITSGRLKRLREDNTSDDSSFTEDSTKEKNSNEQSIIKSKSHASNNITGKRKKTKSSSSSTSINENTSLSEIKNFASKRLRRSFVKILKISEGETSSDNTDPDETNLNKTKKCICRECGVTFENKLKLVTHELTHSKILELKLHKLKIQDKCRDEEEVDKSRTEKFNDDINEQQNEEITLSINDDEESETMDVTNQNNVTQDTIKKSNKDTKCSFVKNEKKDSLRRRSTTDEKDTKESEAIETVTEPICKDSIKVIEGKDEISESTEQIESVLTPTENNNTSKSIDDDQNQNDGSNNDTVKDIEQLKKKKEETEDKDKKKINEIRDEENKNIEEYDNDTKEKEEDKTEKVKEDNVKEKEDTMKEKEIVANDEENKTEENEKGNDKANETEINTNKMEIDINEMEINTNEKKKGETNEMENNTNETENNTNEMENNISEIKDITKKTKEDETNDKDGATNRKEDETNKKDDTMEEKANEIEEKEHKTKKIEISKAEKEEQNSYINDDSRNLNSKNSVLNVNINLVDNSIGNLNEKDETSTDNKNEKTIDNKDEKSTDNKDEKSTDNKDEKSIDNKDERSTDNKDEKNETNKIMDNGSLENCNESNILTSDTKSIKDNSNSEEIDKQVDISNTTHSSEEKEYTNDAQKLLSDLTTLSEPATSKEVSAINKNNKESINTVVEMVEHVFDLVTNDQQNHLSTIEHNIRCCQLEPETLEDISREIQKSADMPSLDPINSTEMDHNDVSIN